MARRISWSFLLGLGAGLLFLRLAARGQRRGRARRPTPLPREPEVVRGRGPTPVEAGLERPVASASGDPVPGRTVGRQARPHPGPAPVEFEPVVPDAPEERDPAAEPRPVDPDGPAASPVPPVVRRHDH
jgi:hypothetical protein